MVVFARLREEASLAMLGVVTVSVPCWKWVSSCRNCSGLGDAVSEAARVPLLGLPATLESIGEGGTMGFGDVNVGTGTFFGATLVYTKNSVVSQLLHSCRSTVTN